MTDPIEQNTQQYRPWLARYAMLLVLMTLFLIFMGGQVKSHEAGLAVPDWPTTYGENMFTFHYSKWVGGIYHEHVHRLVASGIGLLTIGLLIGLFLRESRKWVRSLGILALVAVIAQGLLGGLTVILLLPAWVSVSHGVLAQTFFMITILLAYALSKEWHTREAQDQQSTASPLFKPALLLTAVIYAQLILGALMRHTESGLAIPDFPMMAGQWLPIFTQESVAWVNEWRESYSFETGVLLDDISLGQIWAHFIHRAGAIVVFVALFWFAKQAGKQKVAFPKVWKTTVVLMALVTIQIALGIITVMSHRVPFITSLHVVTGAATLGVSWLTVLRAMPLDLWQESTVEPLESSSDSTTNAVIK